MVMREIRLSFNQTQNVRLKTALQKLQDLSSKAKSSASVTVSDTINVNHEDGILKGHGTSEVNDEIVATLCGVVERVNKLVYIRSFRSRYKPEIGDIIVGRVIEIAPKRWKLEINFSQDAVLMLSSMNLPDGIQRRRTAIDELNMRSIFEENDVICAEVRGFQHDGSLHLQARSQKYGKLEKGQLLTVPPYLVKRKKQHFHHVEQYGVDLILGCNGLIWVGEHTVPLDNNTEESQEIKLEEDNNPYDRKSVLPEESEQPCTPIELRRGICRLSNAIRVLVSLGFILSIEKITDIADLSVSLNLEIEDMLGAEFFVQVAEREVNRRYSSTKRK